MGKFVGYTLKNNVKNLDSYGVVAYLVVANKQVHTYQLIFLEQYFKEIKVDINDTSILDIVDGKDDALSYDNSLVAFKKEAKSVQIDLLYCMYIIAMLDGSIDDDEREYLNHIAKTCLIDERTVTSIKKEARQQARQYKTTSNDIFIDPLGNNTDDSYLYKDAINKCSYIAQENFKYIKNIYSNVQNEGKNVLRVLEGLKPEMDMSDDLSMSASKIINEFINRTKVIIENENNIINEKIVQKERNISDFTISILGRTKAGKSTLHSILTKEGFDKIGSGKQRTTRYNRVYQWNLLRIIDTPGIGSAEAAGRNDDEIARSVLGESDIICFVVVDDSILDDILSFMKNIAKLNKPIIVLLNHKENICNEVKLKRFMKNPTDWVETTGESNLSGYVDRIKRYAETNGFGQLVSVQPVFLLAAQMAMNPNYSTYKKVLWENSHIDNFVKYLKKSIIETGTLKRSQTILDESVIMLNDSIKQIREAQKPLIKQKTELMKSKEENMRILIESKKKTMRKIQNLLKDNFDDLARNKSVEFAERNYKNSSNIDEKWKAYVKDIGFEDKIKKEINDELLLYSKKAEEVLNELFESLNFTLGLSFSLGTISVPTQIDFGNIVGPLLEGVAVIVAGILGLIKEESTIGKVAAGATMVAAIVGLASHEFIEGRKKGKVKIQKGIEKKVTEQANEQISNYMYEIDRSLSETMKKAEKIFTYLINSTNELIFISERIIHKYMYFSNDIDQLYAMRIVQYLLDGFVGANFKVNKNQIKVDRNEKGVITIECGIKNLDTNKLKDVITETVIIK